MARKPDVDGRQPDFFGAPAPAPERRPPLKPGRDAKRPPPDGEAASSGGGADVPAARLSRSELNSLVASLPDEALGHLVLAAVRQLRRRLARAGRVSLRGRGDAGRTSVLERSAQQLIAELSEGGHDDDDWGAG